MTRARYVNGVWTGPRARFSKRPIRNGAALGDMLARAVRGEPVEGVSLEDIAEHRVATAEYHEDR